MLETRLSVTGSSPALKTIGMFDVVALVARPERWPPVGGVRAGHPTSPGVLRYRSNLHDAAEYGALGAHVNRPSVRRGAHSIRARFFSMCGVRRVASNAAPRSRRG